MLNIQEKNGGVTIECYVTPRAGKNRIKGERNGALAVALNAPPVEGKANEELISFISDLLDVPKSHVAILKGNTGRNKIVFIKGIAKEKVQRLIEG